MFTQLHLPAQHGAPSAQPETPRRRGFDDIDDVVRLTRMSKSWIYQEVRAGRFPQPRRIGSRAVAWLAEEIDQWVATRGVAGASR